MPSDEETSSDNGSSENRSKGEVSEVMDARRRAMELLRGGSTRSPAPEVKESQPLERMREKDPQPEPAEEEKKASNGAASVEKPKDPDLAARIVNWAHLTPYARRALEQGTQEVDKYFGTKLPPVCRQSGCYMTDNGKFFYCIDSTCHKDRKRETKYNRRKRNMFYFFCPKCRTRDIQLHLLKSSYECLACGYSWAK